MNALEFAKRAQNDMGMDRDKAEAFAQLMDEYTRSNAATKADVDLVRVEMQAMEARIGKVVADSRNTVVYWVAGLLIVATGVNHIWR